MGAIYLGVADPRLKEVHAVILEMTNFDGSHQPRVADADVAFDWSLGCRGIGLFHGIGLFNVRIDPRDY
jgi:hypothetical protein